MQNAAAIKPATRKPVVNTGSPVDRPSHYQSPGGYEVFDLIDAYGLGFYAGNAVKNICRSNKKGDAAENLRKAAYNIRHIASSGGEPKEARAIVTSRPLIYPKPSATRVARDYRLSTMLRAALAGIFEGPLSVSKATAVADILDTYADYVEAEQSLPQPEKAQRIANAADAAGRAMNRLSDAFRVSSADAD